MGGGGCDVEELVSTFLQMLSQVRASNILLALLWFSDILRTLSNIHLSLRTAVSEPRMVDALSQRNDARQQGYHFT